MAPDHPFPLRPRRAILLTLQLVGLQLAIGLAIGIAIGVATSLAHLVHGLPPGPAAPTGPMTIVVGNVLAFGFVLRRELRRAHAPWSSLLRPAEKLAPLLLPFLCAALAQVIIASELDNVVRVVAPTPAWLTRFFGGLTDLNEFPVSTPLALVVVAPLTEEFLFRALILRGLASVTTPWRAILISATLFMAMHLNPWQFPTAFVLGVLLGWIYLRTRSIALCLAAHAFNNACVLLVAGLPVAICGFNVPSPGRVVFQPWWFDLGGLALLALAIALFRRRTPPPAVGMPEPPVLPPPLPEVSDVPA